jgi:hypothetical protein
MENFVMLVQRKFIGLSALCLSLAACGGGGGGSANDANVAGSATNVDVAQHPASVSGTAIPPATAINDSSGAVWTLNNGVVFRAGQSTNSTGTATLVLWYAGKMYMSNSANVWSVWSNSSWAASTDPRPVAAATAAPAAAAPAAAATPAKTTTTATTSTTAVSAATPTSTGPAIPFYGINGHYVQGGLSASVPLSTQAASLADLGVTNFRQDMYTTQDIDSFVNTVIPGLGSTVQVQPVIIANPYDDPSLNGATPTEASAYAYAYTISAYAATKFPGIPVVEFGNEYDLDSHNAAIASDGESITDYDNSTFPIWRGSLRGAEDGWRSVDTGHVTKVIANATSGWLHFGFLAGLMNGTQPDGTTGHPTISPDIIQWHWYQDGGDFENAIGTSGTYNVLATLKSTYNLPIIFTEIGSSPDQTTAAQQAYITKTVAELAAAKAAYNVVGANWYELYDYPNDSFGVLTSGSTKKATYATLKSMIAANPVK